MTDGWLNAKAKFGKQEVSLPVNENLIAGRKIIFEKQKGK